ncbi:MAG: hypothetical protein WCD79_21285 [Chthoniobacteraceae bacterium]
MIFNDDNTLEDIQGLIYCLFADVEVEHPESKVNPRLDELIGRIQEKFRRNTNSTRASWFGIALGHAEEAKRNFESGQKTDSKNALRKCLEYLEEGNKAHQRKTTFIVAPDGTATPTGQK